MNLERGGLTPGLVFPLPLGEGVTRKKLRQVVALKMKRCPQCSRVETDDALVFCRIDGTALVSDSGSISTDANTAKFASAPVSSEIETGILPHTSTTPEINRPTAPTTVLPSAQAPGTTHELSKPSRRGLVFATVALAVIGIAIAGYFYFSRKSNASIQSIAVMPFVNASGNADLEYLSDGMTETLIRSLSQLPNLNVKARSSVFRYKGKETDAKTICKEFDVPAILNGRLTQRGDQLTLNLELIDAQTENVLWTDQYDRKSSDLVSLQNEIARDVSTKLRTKLSGTDKQKLAKTYTTNPEAYRLYLQGRFYWNKREEKDFRKAVEYFNQAIALDPNYALAYVGLADSYALLYSFGFMPPTEAIPKARDFARRASSLDDSMAEPHATLAYVSLTYDYDFAS